VRSASAQTGKAFGFFAVLFIAAFILNWFWEVIQMPAFFSPPFGVI